ncbi:hypothetical protein ACFL0U_01285 [Pseudomonadota bacterium]
MTIQKPYKRTYRQFKDGEYTEGGRSKYIEHIKFAEAPEKYIRAFLLILKDLQELFDYVEPSDKNLKCYSYRIHSLLVRTCIEIETNFQAILMENEYKKKKSDLNMHDYIKIEKSHFLSKYKIKIPNWDGSKSIHKPFSEWKSFFTDSEYKPLTWYKIFTETKHNRHDAFKKANFGTLINAICGLLVILSAQFGTNDFVQRNEIMEYNIGPNDGMKTGIGELFRVQFPKNIPDDLMYDFNWEELKNDENPFQNFDY